MSKYLTVSQLTKRLGGLTAEGSMGYVWSHGTGRHELVFRPLVKVLKGGRGEGAYVEVAATANDAQRAAVKDALGDAAVFWTGYSWRQSEAEGGAAWDLVMANAD